MVYDNVSTDQDKLLDDFVEVKLKTREAFNIIVETLQRIGVASKHSNTIYQSCHILHKRGKYYILHFKELFKLDRKPTDFTDNDRLRRNAIANLLASWGLLELVDPEKSKDAVPLNQIKIISFKEKENWQLCSKYTVGIKK